MKNPAMHIRSIVSLLVVLLISAHSNAQSPDPANAAPKFIKVPPPFELPQEAIEAGLDGTLMIVAELDSTGLVTSTRVLAGPEWPCGTSPRKEIEKVHDLATSNVRQSKFSPATKNGKPVGTEIALSYFIGRAYKDLLKKRDAGKTANPPQTVKAGVVNGKALSLPKPDYPNSARAKRASGPVTISILIDETGKVGSAGARNGHPLLQDAARDAACKARFAPTTVEGKPVRVSGVITYNFIAPSLKY